MIATSTEVIQVSRRLVQVILRASERTSRANWPRLTRFFFGASAASAEDGTNTAAVLAARLRIAVGAEPKNQTKTTTSISRFWSSPRGRPGSTTQTI